MPIKRQGKFCTMFVRTQKEKEQDKLIKDLKEYQKKYETNKKELKEAKNKISNLEKDIKEIKNILSENSN